MQTITGKSLVAFCFSPCNHRRRPSGQTGRRGAGGCFALCEGLCAPVGLPGGAPLASAGSAEKLMVAASYIGISTALHT